MDKRTLRSKKARPRNARPYDRQNQSIFGKVYSTVKGLLNPWLPNVSQWIGNSDEQQPGGSSDDVEEETVREDNDVCQSVSHGSKRLRLRFEENVPSIQSSGTQTPWPEQQQQQQRPPSQNLFETISRVQSPATQRSLVDNKDAIAVLNGDDHSENSEGSASTSGCSSLVSSHKESNRLGESSFVNLNLLELKNRKRKLSSSKSGINDLDSSRALWSSNFSPKFQRRLPTISHTNQPSFNLSTFVGPSKNETMEKKVSSPFYEGRTTFGGASASRRMPPSVTHYQTDRNVTRNKIRVREQTSEDSLEGMSSAAKRILLTLEKMSSPVTDAQRIPNSDTSPIDLSLYLTPPKSRRNTQFTPSIASKGPPIANINTIAKLATLKNYGASRLRSTLLTPSPSNSKVEKKTDLPSKPFVFSNPIEPELPISSSSNSLPKENIPVTVQLINPSCDSKVEKASDTRPKPFVFSSPIEHELPNNSLPKENIPLSTLDSKIEKSSDMQPKPFTFSSPIEHELPNNNTLPKEITPLPVSTSTGNAVSSLPEWVCSSCWVRNAHSRTSCIACETPKVSKETKAAVQFKGPEINKSNPAVSSTAPSSSSTGFSFSIPTSSPAVFTFGSPQPVSQNVATSKLLFGPCKSTVKPWSEISKWSTWECSSCSIKNADGERTCRNCRAPRPQQESQPAKGSEKKAGSTWKCDCCSNRNTEEELKCHSCEKPRSEKESEPLKKVNSTVSSPFSTWECTSCWVRNPMKEKKCMACETLHPSADVTPGFKFKSSEKPTTTSAVSFSTPKSTTSLNTSSSTPVSSVGLIFGTPKTDSQASTPITFKFGSGPEKSQTAPVSTTQSTASTVVSSSKTVEIETSKAETKNTPTTNFSFGSGMTSSNKSTFQLSQPEKATFKFGVPSTESTAPTVTTSSTLSLAKSEASNQIPSSGTLSTVVTSSSATSNFVFGSKSDTSNQIPSTVSQPSGLAVGSSSNFTFGGKNETVSTASKNTTPVFGSSTTVSSIFGNNSVTPSTGADKPSSGGFKFNAATSGAFQFGSSNKTSTVNSTATITTPAASEWKCSACWIKNPQDRTLCMACETPRVSKDTSSAKSAEEASKNKEETKSMPVVSSAASVSSTGFTFSNAASTPAVFSFGATKSESQTVTSSKPFSFGLGSNATDWECKSCLIKNPETESKCKACQVPRPSKEKLNVNSFAFKSSDKPATSLLTSTTSQTATPAPSTGIASIAPSGGFVFGAPKTEPQNTTTKGFAFSSGLEKPQIPSSISAPTSQPAASVTVSTSAPAPSENFVFRTPKTEPQNTVPAPFSFGSGVEKPQTTSVTSSTSQSNTPGLNVGTTAPAAFGGFVFGAPKTEAQTTPAPSFPFASGATPSTNASAFSVFQPTQSNAAFKFKFGSQPESSTAVSLGTSSTFSFTKSGASNQAPNAVSQNPPSVFGSTNANFVFGSKSGDTPNQIPSTVSQPSGLTFGSSSTPNFTFSGKNENASATPQNPPPAFGSTTMQSVFGSTPVQSLGGSDKPASGGFNFGVSNSGVFQFGASSNNADKKRTATASGFSFGGAPAAPETNSLSTGFNMSTPPSFNFGATSTPAGGPFQFAASTAPRSTPVQASAHRKIRKAVRRVPRNA